MHARPSEPIERDAGLGLVEVVVAMMLFLIVTLSFVPVLTRGLAISARNTAAVTATQAATSMVEDARVEAAKGCEAFITWLDSFPQRPKFGREDGLGRPLTVTIGLPDGIPVCDPDLFQDTKVNVVVVVSRGDIAGDAVAVPLGGDVDAKVTATVRVAGKVVV